MEIVGSTSGIFTRPLLVLTCKDKLGEAATGPSAAKSSRRLQRADFIRQFLASLGLFPPLVLIKRLAELARYRRRLNRSRASRCFGRGVLRWRARALFSPRLMQLLSRLWKKNCGGRFGGHCHGRRLRARRR